MKKLSIFCLTALLLFFSLSPALAVSELPMVVDNSNILLPEEEAVLLDKAAQLCNTYEIDVVILTEDSLEGLSAQIFADDFYENQGYADDGILILLAMAEREWYISTCGKVIYAVTDHGTQQLGEAALGYFSDDDYLGGFLACLDQLAFLMDAYESGAPMDGFADGSHGYYHAERVEAVYYEEESRINWLLSLGIGAIAAGISVWVMRSSMNTNKPQRGASGYIGAGSFHLNKRRDLFLYSNVQKVRRQQSQSSSHSRGGGSSVHRTSGGRRHGGGGGKF